MKLIIVNTTQMKNYQLSINPFAEFIEASVARKTQILKEQMNPDPVRIPYYHLAKARMKQSILNNGDFSQINEGIKELTERKPVIKWKIADRKNSIEALNNFKEMLLPDLITQNKLEVINKVKLKQLTLFGIPIKMAPNLIFRITLDGKNYIGAIKIHISKNKCFSISQSKVVATLLNQYLSNCVAEENDIVHPELCICIDPFSKTTINSFSKIKYDMTKIKEICREIPKIWEMAEKQSRVA